MDLEASGGSQGSDVFIFVARALTKVEAIPQEHHSMTRESDIPMEAGVSEWRSELGMEDFPPGSSTAEGMEHMEASIIDQGLTHEAAMDRLRQVIHSAGTTVELVELMEDKAKVDL
ncbi:hypothetical protein COCNU_03G007830 [Cocos nucifera]|uniref:Uncharacterized protein n=1 Tax=Cocos nucifera TaxID=13894 RepID=A0A8K0MYR4_COCNU|nr:hypothetical protein COCNU_03G007830 [Cocos nucifera]